MIDYSQYTVPEIKAELKKRGLCRTGKKADLVVRLHTTIENEAFTLFPKLPAEIRDRIWTFALPPRRIVDISTGPMGMSLSTCRPRLTAAMNIMLATKEAYAIAARRYRPTPTPSWCQSSPEDRHKRSEVNFHDDVFHLDAVPDAINGLVRMNFYMDPALMETVAFPIQELEECFFLDELKSLLQLKGLKEIILVDDLRKPPNPINCRQNYLTAYMNMMHPPKLDPPSFLGSYSQEPLDPYFDKILEKLLDIVAEDPELKPLKKVKIYFSQFR